MRDRNVNWGVLGLAAALSSAGCQRQATESPTQGRLVVTASESHAPLLRRAAELFNSLYPEAQVEVRAQSTREAFIALVEDSVRIAAVDRAANAEERLALERAKVHVTEVRIGEDALGVFVHPSNTLGGLTREQLADVLGGRTTDWQSLPGAGVSGRIQLVLPSRNSGIWELLTSMVGPGTALAPAQVAATEAEVLAQVLAQPNAVGVASIAAWKDPGAAHGVQIAASGEPGWANGISTTGAGALRALDALVADSTGTWVAHPLHQANVHSGAYPWHFPVSLLFNQESRLAAGFASFVASAPGQKLVLGAGLVPATMPVRLVTLK